MSENKKEEFIYEYEQAHKPFDFINKDLDLLFLLIFIEAYKAGKSEFNFSDFFKGDYWDIDQVSGEVMDTNDYYAIADMVIEQVLFIFEDTRMGKIMEVGIDNVDFAITDLLIEVAKIGKENAGKEAQHFQPSFDQLYFLSNQKEKQIQEESRKNPEFYKSLRWKDKSIFFTKEQGYFRALQTLFIQLPSHIIIRVKYNEIKVQEIEKEIADYLENFSQDRFFTEPPVYQEKRLYFSQQIENFYRYISRLNLIGDVINIPFTILNENGFEAVKILYYLQIKGAVEMRWSDESSWKVQFTKVPITPQTLLGIDSKTIHVEDSLKSGLSYNEATAILAIGQHSLKINGPDQKDFLKIIFKHPEELNKEWFFSEISEIFDSQMDSNNKKFYNASYQVNLKVAQKTPIKDFLITTKHSVRINPKYLTS